MLLDIANAQHAINTIADPPFGLLYNLLELQLRAL